jgi:hypothetical protein
MAQTADRQRPSWFRIGPDLTMRVSDADRAEVADRLARHYGDGRLSQAEFDERVTRAMAAKTVGDFQGLLDDLPDQADLPGDTQDDTASGTARTPGTWPPAACHAAGRRGGPLRRPVRTLLIVALVLVAANIAWHALMGWVMPLAWIAVIVAVIVLVSKRGRR